mmetsp:Transcript_7539/g.19430  ORF Transcript_7539/g.19430 Transcript_7539/m.19430 type:complete len:287 (-) Transcript_7539:536-1396(-)|eukprot:CAMPEP_0182919514 /NCGR_PEP_ID=MMETSP0105_2-20130417/2779_1 /TAXON_ID=81532 ORGANISM="Acanthoeca-like sp., Strain 10tr" /NCGR_SAMPLE_ID=MMETSP0105_2 /ASSEMBLY_ACC=CAM_ASM_000205 /LENGTH=286 /DNA_ID=CAMNT_0025056713 /DNA_START=71 /DNA_END=931 /DNA_ORIENTATION=-
MNAEPQVQGFVFMPDPSEFRPEHKGKEAFRVYDETPTTKDCVRRTYTEMHTQQTVAYGEEMRAKWLKFDHFELDTMGALDLLNKVVDESDPDTDLPNIVHAFQTAERIREQHPDKDWFHLTGLIHDLGKVMALYGQPQWSTVGDTYVVGCAPSPAIVFPETFENCPDSKHPVYSTKLGIYKEGCGFDDLMFSWGHDEYLYQVLRNHGATIPDEGMYMIRFHSFYPWHTGNTYKEFESEKDKAMLPWVREFNKFDLYSKSDSIPDVEALKPYYQSLVDKYMPGLIRF